MITSAQSAARPLELAAQVALKRLPRVRHARWQYLWLCVAIILTSLSVVQKANAESATGNFIQDWLAQPTMLGDWGGLRTDLEQDGISFDMSYIGDGQRNTNGLYGIATDYAQSIYFLTNVDLGQIDLDPGGIFHFALSERAGHDIGPEKLGSLFQTTIFYGQGRVVRLSEISFEQSFFNTLLNLKVGFFPMSGNDYKEYIMLPAFADFITSAHHPAAIALDSSGVDYSPTGHWGGRIRFTPSDDLFVLAGVFQVNPDYFEPRNAFDVDFQGDTGVIFPVEVAYQPSLGSDLPGIYKLGAYYDTSKAPDQLTPTKLDQGRQGFYVEMQQKIFSESANPADGLTIMGYFASNDQNTGPLKQNYHVGLSYRGVFSGRDLDSLSIGWFAADINSRTVEREEITGQSVQSATEGLLELNYAAQLAPWLTVTPVAQYVVNPGSIAAHPNAGVFILQIEANF
jgi:porin